MNSGFWDGVYWETPEEIKNREAAEAFAASFPKTTRELMLWLPGKKMCAIDAQVIFNEDGSCILLIEDEVIDLPSWEEGIQALRDCGIPKAQMTDGRWVDVILP